MKILLTCNYFVMSKDQEQSNCWGFEQYSAVESLDTEEIVYEKETDQSLKSSLDNCIGLKKDEQAEVY